MKKAAKATFCATLVFHDEPQLVLMKTSRKLNMLAVAVFHDSMKRAFFGCEVSKRDLEKYMNGKADLLYIFKGAVGGAYYLFDMSKMKDKSVSLTLANEVDSQNPDYFPLEGIFSDSHTHDVDCEDERQPYELLIAGNWEASEFSRLHSKFSDIYAFLAAIERAKATPAGQDAEFISKAIRERFWRGGGSYVGFYDDIIHANDNFVPLKVCSINYASPGKIVLNGDERILNSEITPMLMKLGEVFRALNKEYGELNAVLTREGLRTSSINKPFSNADTATAVKERAVRIATGLNVDHAKLFSLCGDNILAFSKVVLSLFRRARDLHFFIKEGRVRLN